MVKFDSERVLERASGYIQERLDKKLLAGVVAGVWIEEKKVLGITMGKRDPINGEDITEDTLFRLASMTKPITGAAVMRQWEKGLIDLDTPVSYWMPEFSKMQAYDQKRNGEIRPIRREITPRMLLTHTSGLGSLSKDITESMIKIQEKRRTTNSLKENVDMYPSYILDFQPGEKQVYSGIMAFDVLARLVELTSDMKYDDYLKKYIFDPLEMKDTTYLPTEEQQKREMAFVKAENGKIEAVPISSKSGFVGFADGYTSGGAGLFSTIEDYSHLAEMYLNDGMYKGQRILNKATVELMSCPQLSCSFDGIDEYFNWGLSMRVVGKQNGEAQPLTEGSFGWSGAFGSHFWIDRSKKLFAIYMSNLQNGGGSGDVNSKRFEIDVMSGFN